MSHPPRDFWLKAYLDLLGNLGKAFVVCTVVTAVWSSVRYCSTAPSVEQINNRDLSPFLTCLLLWIPIIIQALVFWRLRKQITEASSDATLRNFFRFYSRRMALSLLAYTLLWCCYAHALWQSGDRFAWFIKWMPPIGIVILMGIIIHATYLITRLSFTNNDRLLTEEEVSSRYESIAKALQSDDGTPGGIIRAWLSRNRDYKISQAALLRNIDNVDPAHLTEALNKLICSSRFHNQINRADPTSTNKASDGSSPKDIEQFNRSYLDQHLLGLTAFLPASYHEKANPQHFKLIEQQEQRNGMATFPFYSLVFFFSIFICIAYLFGFAFAFEDKYVQLIGPKGQVALHMTDELLEDAGREIGSPSFRISDFKKADTLAHKLQDPDNTLAKFLHSQFSDDSKSLLRDYGNGGIKPDDLQSALVYEFNKILRTGKSLYEDQRFKDIELTDETKKLLRQSPRDADLIRLNRLLLEDAYPTEIRRSNPASRVAFPAYTKRLRKMFYFNSGGAGLQIGAGSEFDNNDKYISRMNDKSFSGLMSVIVETLDVGKKARVVLVGRADDNGMYDGALRKQARNTYASNLDLATTRIKTVRYELHRMLLQRDILPSQIEGIDWTELAVSNDQTLPLKALAEDEAAPEGDTFNDNVVTNGFMVPPGEGSQKASEQARPKTDLCSQDIGRKAVREEALGYCLRLQAKAPKLKVERVNYIYNLIQEWKALATKEPDLKAAEIKKDTVEEELYRLESLDGSKRTVEVFFYEVDDFQPQPHSLSKRMALMDYLYFAMYTITTTGYGDIKPVTPYMKFLCTVANITEFFFIVVFFNTLLSLKRVKDETV